MASAPTLDVKGERATISLRRPAQHNRIERDDVSRLFGLLDEVDRDRGIRVVVIAGEGASFSSGYDLGTLLDLDDEKGDAHAAEFGDLCDRLEGLRAPTVCALNGGVYGGAIDLALACDFRVGVTGMQLRMPAARLGLHYYHSGMRRYVTRLGLGAAKRILLLGRSLSSEDLVRVGFLDEVVPASGLDGRVSELAAALAGASPGAVQGMKAALNAIADGSDDPDAIQRRYLSSFTSDDLREGFKAWSEKRPPLFKDPA